MGRACRKKYISLGYSTIYVEPDTCHASPCVKTDSSAQLAWCYCVRFCICNTASVLFFITCPIRELPAFNRDYDSEDSFWFRKWLGLLFIQTLVSWWQQWTCLWICRYSFLISRLLLSAGDENCHFYCQLTLVYWTLAASKVFFISHLFPDFHIHQVFTESPLPVRYGFSYPLYLLLIIK